METLRRAIVFAGIVVLLIASGNVALDAERKPKVPSYSWSMTIPDVSNDVLGMTSNHEYADGVNKTRIYYSEGFDTTYHSTKTSFSIFVDSSYDLQEVVDIQNVVVRNIVPTGDGLPCGFPNNDGCLEFFLNNIHPHPGYDHIMFRLVVYEGLENFTNEEGPWTGQGAITIYFWNSFDCGDGVNVHYHSVTARVLDLNCTEPAGYYITRTGPDSWRFRIESQDFELDEHYCVTEQVQQQVGKSGKYKTVTKTQTYHPQTAWTTLSYVFDLKRTIKKK